MKPNDVVAAFARFKLADYDYDIDYVRDVLCVAVPKCGTCQHAPCDQTVGSCLDYGVIELRVVVVVVNES